MPGPVLRADTLFRKEPIVVRIQIIGGSGTGKSTLGAFIGQAEQIPWIDTTIIFGKIRRSLKSETSPSDFPCMKQILCLTTITSSPVLSSPGIRTVSSIGTCLSSCRSTNRFGWNVSSHAKQHDTQILQAPMNSLTGAGRITRRRTHR